MDVLYKNEVMGYFLDVGTIVLPCIYLTHHREDLYPDSKQFKPKRFLERQYAPNFCHLVVVTVAVLGWLLLCLK